MQYTVSCILLVLFLYYSYFKPIKHRLIASVFIMHAFIAFLVSLKKKQCNKGMASSSIILFSLRTSNSNALYKLNRLFPFIYTVSVQLLVVVNRLFRIFVCSVFVTVVLQPGTRKKSASGASKQHILQSQTQGIIFNI